MNTAILSLTLATFASIAVVGNAAGRQQGPGPDVLPPSQLLQALDLNKDGVLSKAELAKAASSLGALDLNGDGVISAEEFMPAPPPAFDGEDAPPPPPPEPLLAALDSDGDGVIDGAELAAASDSLLSLDRNGDGVLSLEELRPAHPPRGPRAG